MNGRAKALHLAVGCAECGCEPTWPLGKRRLCAPHWRLAAGGGWPRCSTCRRLNGGGRVLKQPCLAT